jgi:hypothetical protein
MIWAGDRYITLMASLPSIGFLSEKEPPINRAKLTERMRALAPEDAQTIDELAQIISWRHIDVGDDDAAFVARAEAAIGAVSNPVLAAAAREQIELRTVLAALRRRHAGEEAPAAGTRWGFGPHVERMRTQWALPDLGVGAIHPWVLAAREKLESGDTVGLERLVLETSWNALDRHAAGHEFDLVAVAFYMLRWSLAERWARYDAEAAQVRFGELLDAALASAPELAKAA